MPTKTEGIATGSAVRSQAIEVQQIGNNADATLSVEAAAQAAASAAWLSSPIVRGKGKIKRIYGANLTTALTGNATHDIIPRRFNPSNGVAKGATTIIPMLASPGLRLTSADLAGVIQESLASALAEDEQTVVLQAPGGANQVKLPAADAKPDGWYADASIEVIAGKGVGQKNRLTSFANATKIAAVLYAEGTPNWKVATDATSVVRIRTRHYVFNKGDQISFAEDFTVGTGAAGVDCLAGIEVEYDDTVDV